MLYIVGVTTTTITNERHSLTITTTVELPTAPSFPIRIPALGRDYNTASAVANLYDRRDG